MRANTARVHDWRTSPSLLGYGPLRRSSLRQRIDSLRSPSPRHQVGQIVNVREGCHSPRRTAEGSFRVAQGHGVRPADRPVKANRSRASGAEGQEPKASVCRWPEGNPSPPSLGKTLGDQGPRHIGRVSPNHRDLCAAMVAQGPLKLKAQITPPLRLNPHALWPVRHNRVSARHTHHKPPARIR